MLRTGRHSRGAVTRGASGAVACMRRARRPGATGPPRGVTCGRGGGCAVAGPVARRATDVHEGAAARRAPPRLSRQEAVTSQRYRGIAKSRFPMEIGFTRAPGLFGAAWRVVSVG